VTLGASETTLFGSRGIGGGAVRLERALWAWTVRGNPTKNKIKIIEFKRRELIENLCHGINKSPK
jgi:hypothetical protein